MSVSHEWTPQGLVTTFAGTLTLHDLLQHIEEVVRPLNLNRARRALSDFTAVTDIAINANDVAEYARLEADFLDIRGVQHDIRLAIVYDRPEFGTLVDMFISNQRAGSLTVGKFTSVEAAREWVFGD